MKLQETFRDWNDIVEYRAGSVIFSERDPADVMYVIISGEVELTLAGEPLGMEVAGGMLGEMAMTHPEGTRSATATAISKVKLARLNRDQFRAFVSENIDFAFHVMSVLANRLIVANAYISRLLK
jgi:CRP-like cAMP-binding protein